MKAQNTHWCRHSKQILLQSTSTKTPCGKQMLLQSTSTKTPCGKQILLQILWRNLQILVNLVLLVWGCSLLSLFIKKKLLISGEIEAEDGEDQLNVQFYFEKKFNSNLLLVYKWFTDNKSLVAMATVQCTYMIQCQASSWFISNLQLQLCIVGWVFNIPVRSSPCEKPKCLKYAGVCTRRPPMKMKPL